MSKQQTPYKPYFTAQGDYAVNIPVIGNDNLYKQIDESVAIKNIFGNQAIDISKPTTNADLYKLAGAIILCSYHGKDFYDLLAIGCSSGELLGNVDNEAKEKISKASLENRAALTFPYNYNSVYWHLFNNQLTEQQYNKIYRAQTEENAILSDRARNSGPAKQPIQMEYLGIDSRLTAAYVKITPSENKPKVVHIYQVVYKSQYFNSLYDMSLKGNAKEKFDIDMFNTNPVTSKKLVFDNRKDFENKIDSIRTLLDYYEKIKNESFLIIEENKIAIEFEYLAELLEDFKSDMQEQLKINDQTEGRKFSFEVDLYKILQPKLETGRSADIIKRIKSEESTNAAVNLIEEGEKEYEKNILYKGFDFAKEPAGQYHDLNSRNISTFSEINQSYTQAIYKSIIQPQVEQGGSSVNSFLLNLFSASLKWTFYTSQNNGDIYPEIINVLPLRNIDPKVILLLSNLRDLVKLSKKSVNSEEGCINSYTDLARSQQTAAKLLYDSKNLTTEDLKNAEAQSSDPDGSGLELNPPGISEFSKKYIQYPKDNEGNVILPDSFNTVGENTYTPIRIKLSNNLSDDDKIKLYNTSRNALPLPRFKEGREEVILPNGQRTTKTRRLSSVEVSGFSFFNDATGEAELDFDIKNLVGRRNRTFADQIGDEIFKITPRTPAKIRNLDDAYNFFLAKLDLSTIAREALKCTFLKYSVDDFIEKLCDVLLDNFFSAFGTNTEEVVNFIENVKTKQYKVAGVDLSFSVQKTLQEIETAFEKWSIEQNVKLTQTIAGESIENEQDLSKPPPLGSESFYSTISDSFDGGTKRALCELLIAGAVYLTNTLIELYRDTGTPSLEERISPKAELQLKACRDNYSFNIPDNLPNYNRILTDITSQIERKLRDYTEQFIITPLKESLLEILSCGDNNETNSPDLGDIISDADLANLFGGLGTEPANNALLKAYIRDVFSSLNLNGVCSLLKGIPSDKSIGTCMFIKKAEKYKSQEFQNLFTTKSQIVSFFKSLGNKSNLEACSQAQQLAETTDLCNDYSRSRQNLKNILATLGLDDEQINDQINITKKIDRANMKGLINSIFGNPNNLVSESQITDIVSKSEGFKKVNNKALDLVLDPLETNMKAYQFQNFQEEYARSIIRKEISSLALDPVAKKLYTDKTAANPYGETRDEPILGSFIEESQIPLNPDSDKVQVGNFVYSETNMFGDTSRAAQDITELSDIENFFTTYYPVFTSNLISLFNKEGDYEFKNIVENMLTSIQKQIFVELPKENVYAKAEGVYKVTYSDFILNLENLKSIIAELSSQNYSELAEGELVPPTHLYDAVYEGIVALYSRLFLVQLIMNCLYVFDTFSPEYVLSTNMVKEYVQTVAFPSIGEDFEAITAQFEKVSNTYLKKESSFTTSYKASLNQLNNLVADMFNKTEKVICNEQEARKTAFPTTFENSNKIFKYLDVGDAMVYNNLVKDNQLFFENYVTFDKIKANKLTPQQKDDLLGLGIFNIEDPNNPSLNEGFENVKQTISEKELFEVYKILFNNTDFEQTPANNLLPLGFYVKDPKDAEFIATLEGKDDNNSVFYSPNYQTYKMMYGFIAEKYFKTAIQQFADGTPIADDYSGKRAWPQDWFDASGNLVLDYEEILQFISDEILKGIDIAGVLTIQEKNVIKGELDSRSPSLSEYVALNDVLINTWPFILGEAGLPGAGEDLFDKNTAKGIKSTAKEKTGLQDVGFLTDSQFRVWVAEIWRVVIEDLLPPEVEKQQAGMRIKDLFTEIDQEFMPGDNSLTELKNKVLLNQDLEIVGTGNQAAFDKYYNENHYFTSNSEGVLDSKVGDMFFPRYYREKIDSNHTVEKSLPDIGKMAVFNSPDYSKDPDLILEGSLSLTEKAMTADPVFVEDYTNNFFYWASNTEEGITPGSVNENIASSDYRVSLLPDKRTRAGVCGRMVGKFYFDEPHPAAVKYFNGEKMETKELTLNSEKNFSLLTRDTFIEKFNSYRNKVNPLYQDLIQTLKSNGTLEDGISFEIEGEEEKKYSFIKKAAGLIPNNIVELRAVENSDYIEAIDSQGNTKQLYFKEIVVRVPVRLTSEQGTADGDWFSSDEYTKVYQGNKYEDDANTLGFIYTKQITVVRVYYVENPNENFLAENSDNHYTSDLIFRSKNQEITEQTRICQIFDNFKYGMRVSLNIPSQNDSNEAEDKLANSLQQLLLSGKIDGGSYYYDKKYLNMVRPKSQTQDLTPFSELFKNSDFIPENPETFGADNTIILDIGPGISKKTEPVVVLPLAKSEISFVDIENNEEGVYIFRSDKLKDIFKNFPSHTSQTLTSPASDFVTTEKLYGGIVGNQMYCDINKNETLRDFFKCGIKIQNLLSLLAIRTLVNTEDIQNSYGLGPQYKITKESLQKILDFIIRDREGDDI